MNLLSRTQKINHVLQILSTLDILVPLPILLELFQTGVRSLATIARLHRPPRPPTPPPASGLGEEGGGQDTLLPTAEQAGHLHQAG